MPIPSYSDFIRTNKFETFEEQERRIKKERLAKMQASISIPKTSVEPPVESPVEPPVKSPVESPGSKETKSTE